jgi:ATP/maltotriose-dependent transcriptional regulator MalT
MLAQALVESGEAARAAAIMTELERRYPLDTLIQSYWGPIVRAEMALDAGKAAEAVRLAQLAEPWDMGIFSPGQCMDAAYVRGRALLAQRQGAEAAVEFRRILDHRGVVLSCPNSALAQLGLSRALATSGDAAASRHAYQDLFALWKDAQPRLKPLQQARVEYAALH